MLNRRRFLTISAAALGVGAIRYGQNRAHHWRALAFGGEVSLTLYGDKDQAQEAIAALSSDIAAMEAAFSLFDPQSEISRLNSGGALEGMSGHFSRAIALSRHVHQMSDGRFDPTIQPLWQGEEKPEWGMDKLAIGVHGLRFLKPAMALTLNGIAQGYASDVVSALLAQRGFGKALINMGEYRALGGRFALAIESQNGREMGRIGLDNAAVATSSPYAMASRKGAAHILDPLKGDAPIWNTVSVKAKSAALADGFSTALCMMPKGEIAALIARHDAIERVWVEDRQGQVSMIG